MSINHYSMKQRRLSRKGIILCDTNTVLAWKVFSWNPSIHPSIHPSIYPPIHTSISCSSQGHGGLDCIPPWWDAHSIMDRSLVNLLGCSNCNHKCNLLVSKRFSLSLTETRTPRGYSSSISFSSDSAPHVWTLHQQRRISLSFPPEMHNLFSHIYPFLFHVFYLFPQPGVCLCVSVCVRVRKTEVAVKAIPAALMRPCVPR